MNDVYAFHRILQEFKSLGLKGRKSRKPWELRVGKDWFEVIVENKFFYATCTLFQVVKISAGSQQHIEYDLPMHHLTRAADFLDWRCVLLKIRHS